MSSELVRSKVQCILRHRTSLLAKSWLSVDDWLLKLWWWSQCCVLRFGWDLVIWMRRFCSLAEWTLIPHFFQLPNLFHYFIHFILHVLYLLSQSIALRRLPHIHRYCVQILVSLLTPLQDRITAVSCLIRLIFQLWLIYFGIFQNMLQLFLYLLCLLHVWRRILEWIHSVGFWGVDDAVSYLRTCFYWVHCLRELLAAWLDTVDQQDLRSFR